MGPRPCFSGYLPCIYEVLMLIIFCLFFSFESVFHYGVSAKKNFFKKGGGKMIFLALQFLVTQGRPVRQPTCSEPADGILGKLAKASEGKKLFFFSPTLVYKIFTTRHFSSK